MFPLRLFGAALSSVLLWASFFRGYGWLVWGALVPLFWALAAEERRGRGALLGAAFGFLFWALEFQGVLWLRAALGFGVASLALCGMAVLGAVWGGIVGAAGARAAPWGLAGAWVLVEALRAGGPWGVAVGTVPLAFVGTPFLRAAAFLGPWGLSLAASLVNASVAAAIRGRTGRPLAVALLAPALLYALALFSGNPQEAGALEVALVQPGPGLPERLEIPREELLDRYRALLSRVPAGLDLVVLPEDAVPRVLERSPGFRAFFLAESERLRAPILVGGWSLSGGAYYNAAFLFLPSGEVAAVHRKARLLPFGEYVPLRGLWERLGLGRILERFLGREISPGAGYVPAGPYGVMICSETMFPGVARELARKGARLLIALTNDSWFGTSRILWEHFACGALRAAETGRAFLQAATTGITGGFGPDGRPLGTLPKGGRGALALRAPLHSRATPYVRLGDWPVLIAALSLLIGPRFPPWPHRFARRRPPP